MKKKVKKIPEFEIAKFSVMEGKMLIRHYYIIYNN